MSWFSQALGGIGNVAKNVGKSVVHAAGQASPLLAMLGPLGMVAGGAGKLLDGVVNKPKAGQAAVGPVAGVTPPPSYGSVTGDPSTARQADALDQMSAAASARHDAVPAMNANLDQAKQAQTFDTSYMQDKGNPFAKNFAPPTASLAALTPAAASGFVAPPPSAASLPADGSLPDAAAQARLKRLAGQFAPSTQA